MEGKFKVFREIHKHYLHTLLHRNKSFQKPVYFLRASINSPLKLKANIQIKHEHKSIKDFNIMVSLEKTIKGRLRLFCIYLKNFKKKLFFF